MDSIQYIKCIIYSDAVLLGLIINQKYIIILFIKPYFTGGKGESYALKLYMNQLIFNYSYVK